MEGEDLNLIDVVFNLIIEAGHPLTTREIADQINERGLYHPYGYECTVNTSHISNIAKEHPNILSRDLSTRPMKIDIVDFHYEPNYREGVYFNSLPSVKNSSWDTIQDNRQENKDIWRKITDLVDTPLFLVLVITIIFIVTAAIRSFRDKPKDMWVVNNAVRQPTTEMVAIKDYKSVAKTQYEILNRWMETNQGNMSQECRLEKNSKDGTYRVLIGGLYFNCFPKKISNSYNFVFHDPDSNNGNFFKLANGTNIYYIPIEDDGDGILIVNSDNTASIYLNDISSEYFMLFTKLRPI